MAIDDTRLYVIREREYYETPRGQALFAASKAELDAAEADPYGIIREEATRVICLARDPRKYMTTILEERDSRGEPLYPVSPEPVSAPKQDHRVMVGFENAVMVRDMQNNGIITPLKADDIVTRGAGLVNFLVEVRDGKFYATQGQFGVEDNDEITVESIRKRAYRKVGTKAENPELLGV